MHRLRCVRDGLRGADAVIGDDEAAEDAKQHDRSTDGEGSLQPERLTHGARRHRAEQPSAVGNEPMGRVNAPHQLLRQDRLA